MKIALVFDKFLVGGIERLGIIYSKILCDYGYDIDIYILDDHTEELIKDIDPRCNVYIKNINPFFCAENHWDAVLNNKRPHFDVLKHLIIYTFLKIFEPILLKKHSFPHIRYDIAVAFSGHIKDLTLVSNNYIKSNKKIAWLHGSEYSYFMLSPGFFRLYRNIKNLVCLSNLGDEDCEKYNKFHKINKVKIYNPCAIDEKKLDLSKSKQIQEKYGDFCLMVGRLADDKNQELLINAFSVLKSSYKTCPNLLLLGDGPKKGKLQKMIDELELNQNVHLLGNISDVENYYNAAKLYVHAAPLEGLPMVFLEAMTFNLPIVSTDAIPGAREILGNNEYGIIVPDDPTSMAKTINSIYTDNALYKSLTEKSKIRKEYFSKTRIAKELDDFFKSI